MGAVAEAFEAEVREREGCEYVVYVDTRGVPTVGIGHRVTPADGLAVGDAVTPAQVDAFFAADSAQALVAARSQAAEIGVGDDGNTNFVAALASVNFQLGTGWRQEFPRTWAMIAAGDYAGAAAALGTSRWYRETPTRVEDFQKALLALPSSRPT